jgi:hypothetical protein
MIDFYALDKNKVNDTIPFYCSKHNRNLIEAYDEYLKQLRECITKADSIPEGGIETSYNCLNIANLSHPEFNFENNAIDGKLQDEMSDDFCKVNKPTYHDDSFDMNWTNEVSDLNILTQDFSHVAKTFYEYYENDMQNIEKDKRSSVTLSEIRDLKEFFMKAIRSYKDYDSDFMNIHKRLS